MMHQNYEGKTPLDVEIIISEEDLSIYIKLTGFEEMEHAEEYADYLSENLPFLLFESEIKH